MFIIRNERMIKIGLGIIINTEISEYYTNEMANIDSSIVLMQTRELKTKEDVDKYVRLLKMIQSDFDNSDDE